MNILYSKISTDQNSPKRNDLIGVRFNRDRFGSSKPKVSQFQISAIIDQEILGFEITMKDSAGMTEGQSAEELIEEETHILWMHQIVAIMKVLFQVALLKAQGGNQLARKM